MTDFLKDVYEAFSQRLRSPILGSIVLFVLILNWQPIFYLFFADTTVAMRLWYFNLNTDPSSLYCWPVGLGLGSALFLMPMLKFWGARITIHPTTWLKDLEAKSASDRRKKDMMLAADEKNTADRIVQKQIEHIKRIDQAKSDIEDDDLKSEAEAILRSSISKNYMKLEISKLSTAILSSLAESGSGTLVFEDNLHGSLPVYKIENGTKLGDGSHKSVVSVEAAVKELAKEGLIKDGFNGTWTISKAGYDFLDENRG